jgi:hypothetical protein
MRFGKPTQVPVSLHTEAMFDKLLLKHVMLWAYDTTDYDNIPPILGEDVPPISVEKHSIERTIASAMAA